MCRPADNTWDRIKRHHDRRSNLAKDCCDVKISYGARPWACDVTFCLSDPHLREAKDVITSKRLRVCSTDDVWLPYITGNLAATLQSALVCRSSNSTPCLSEFLSTFVHWQHLEKFAYIWQPWQLTDIQSLLFEMYCHRKEYCHAYRHCHHEVRIYHHK